MDRYQALSDELANIHHLIRFYEEGLGSSPAKERKEYCKDRVIFLLARMEKIQQALLDENSNECEGSKTTKKPD